MEKFIINKCEGGSLHLVIGPMFAGKSSELMKNVKRLQFAKKKCLVVNYKADNRYTTESAISTHDKIHMNAVKCEKIGEIANLVKDYDVVAIDEGQFFTDISDWACKFADMGKIVIVAALDGTFQRQAFGHIHELLPQCESITKLTAVCLYCGQNAIFTRRTIKKKEITLIGSHEMYEPVCRHCFVQKEQEEAEEQLETVSNKSGVSEDNSNCSSQESVEKNSKEIEHDNNNNDVQEVQEKLIELTV